MYLGNNSLLTKAQFLWLYAKELYVNFKNQSPSDRSLVLNTCFSYKLECGKDVHFLQEFIKVISLIEISLCVS